MLSPQETAEVVHRTLSGDREAFAELVREHQSLVFALARQHTHNWNEAEDIAQEAFLRAYRDLGKLRNPASFSKWLYGITLNTSKELARSHRPAMSLERMPESIEQVAAETPASSRAGDVDAILAQVARLPAKLRLPLTLHYVKKLKYAEIAGILGIDETAARSRVHRARAILRKWFARAQ